jgi:hypothetical protein
MVDNSTDECLSFEFQGFVSLGQGFIRSETFTEFNLKSHCDEKQGKIRMSRIDQIRNILSQHSEHILSLFNLLRIFVQISFLRQHLLHVFFRFSTFLLFQFEYLGPESVLLQTCSLGNREIGKPAGTPEQDRNRRSDKNRIELISKSSGEQIKIEKL